MTAYDELERVERELLEEICLTDPATSEYADLKDELSILRHTMDRCCPWKESK